MQEKLKVLFVDDEEINLFLFSNYFKNKYEVLTAIDGFKAMSVLDENTDIMAVLSDFKMPRMNGVDFIKQACMKYPEKKYFILSGYDTTDEIKQALVEGIILDKFTKPFSYNKIDSVLKLALQG